MSLVFSIAGAQAPDTPPIITPENAHLLTEINRIGGVQHGSLAWSPDERWLAVGTSEATWVYDTSDLSIEPKRLPFNGECLSFRSVDIVLTCGGQTWNVITGQDVTAPPNAIPVTDANFRTTLDSSENALILTDQRDGGAFTIPIDAPWIPKGVTLSDDATIAAVILDNVEDDFQIATQVWDLAHNRRLAFLEPGGNYLRWVDFNDDGTELLVSTYTQTPDYWTNDTWVLWDVASGQSIEIWEGSQLYAPTTAMRGAALTVFESQQGLLFWNGDEGTLIGGYSYANSEYNPVFWFSADGNVLVINMRDGLRVWEIDPTARTMTPRHTIERFSENPHIDLTHDGALMLERQYSGERARLWDTQSGQLLGKTLTERTIDDAWFAADGTRLALSLSGEPDEIEIWDTETLTPLFTIPGYANLSPRGQTASYWDGEGVGLVDITSGETTRIENLEAYYGTTYALDAANQRILFDDEEGFTTGEASYSAYDLLTGASLGKVTPDVPYNLNALHPKDTELYVFNPIVSPDGRLFAKHVESSPGLRDDIDFLFDMETGETVAEWRVSGYGISDHLFTHNGQHIVTLDWAGSMHFWPVDTLIQRYADGAPILLKEATAVVHYEGLGTDFRTLGISPDDAYVFAEGRVEPNLSLPPEQQTSGYVLNVFRFDEPTPRQPGSFISLMEVRQPAFNADSSLMATLKTYRSDGSDGILIWDVRSLASGAPEPLAHLPFPDAPVAEVAFSPDGTKFYVRDRSSVSVWGIKNTED